jgi:hypothetical protein
VIADSLVKEFKDAALLLSAGGDGVLVQREQEK